MYDAAAAALSHAAVTPVVSPLPMITERQRQQLREAILDCLLNHMYCSMSIAEKSEITSELFVRAPRPLKTSFFSILLMNTKSFLILCVS